jgi:hypothetical protein
MWRQSVEVTSAAARVADGDLVLQGVRAAAELASLVQVLQAAADQQPVPAPAVLVLQQSDHSALLRTTAATLSVRTTRSRPPKASQRSASSHRPREYSSALSTPERPRRHARPGTHWTVAPGSNIAFCTPETSETSSKSLKLSAMWPATEYACPRAPGRSLRTALKYGTAHVAHHVLAL